VLLCTGGTITCGLTACTPGSAPGPTLGNEYGKTLLFYIVVGCTAKWLCLCVIAVVSMLAAVIVYPVMFIVEIDSYRVEFNITQWYFSWSYGIACGAVIFLFGSAVLLAIGKETASIEYREKPKPYRQN